MGLNKFCHTIFYQKVGLNIFEMGNSSAEQKYPECKATCAVRIDVIISKIHTEIVLSGKNTLVKLKF